MNLRISPFISSSSSLPSKRSSKMGKRHNKHLEANEILGSSVGILAMHFIAGINLKKKLDLSKLLVVL